MNLIDFVEDPLLFSSGVQAASTLVLVVVTIVYVWHTRGMATEMRAQRLDAARPLLTIEVTSAGELFEYRVRNLARAPALDIRCFIDGPPFDYDDHEASSLGLDEEMITALLLKGDLYKDYPSAFRIKPWSLLRSEGELLPKNRYRSEERVIASRHRVQVTVECIDIAERRWRTTLPVLLEIVAQQNPSDDDKVGSIDMRGRRVGEQHLVQIHEGKTWRDRLRLRIPSR